jgi:hypothetical protein
VGLADATSVHFGATAATIVSDTSTTIVVMSPLAQAAGSLDVRVTSAAGTSATLPADKFTYFVAPTITMTAPANGTITCHHG